MEEQVTEENPSKLSSRKFIVWVTWLALTLIYTVIFAVYVITTKTLPDIMAELAKLILGYFFTVSCIYLGVNLLGKGISAAKEVLESKEDLK